MFRLSLARPGGINFKVACRKLARKLTWNYGKDDDEGEEKEEGPLCITAAA